jgi:hypothetical protein
MKDQDFSIPKIPSPELKEELDRVVFQGLLPVSIGLGLLFAVFAVSHMLTLTAAIAVPMTIIAGITSLLFFVLYLLARQKKIPLDWSYPIGALMIFVALLNSFLQLKLSGDIYQTTNVMLIVIGISFFLIRDEWFYPLILFSTLGWIISISGIAFSNLTVHFAFGILSSITLAVIIHYITPIPPGS